jgi:hypothetical protein
MRLKRMVLLYRPRCGPPAPIAAKETLATATNVNSNFASLATAPTQKPEE